MVSRRRSSEEGHRRKFLAVIDDTPECERAMRYAGMRARNSGGGLVLVYVIQSSDFQHWLGVEEIMRAEAMEEAESTLAKASARRCAQLHWHRSGNRDSPGQAPPKRFTR